jgi:hypothetical protein
VEQLQKKRHHYVPIAYLSRFADESDRIYAYRKDGPFDPLHVRPSEIAFERYYYSQPRPDGGQDNNRLEDLFSTIETQWPSLVDDLTLRRDIRNSIEPLFEFIGLLRVRVPACRDPIELVLAQLVRQTAKHLQRTGKIPPPPVGFETLLDCAEISIDPHRSILAMVPILKGFGELLQHIGFEIVHNATQEHFITSDNPVIYFDPDMPESKLLPYTIRPPYRRVELLLSISPNLLIRGKSELPMIKAGMQPRHVEIRVASEVRRINRLIARFGYRFVFADHNGLEPLVAKHGATSPTVRFSDVSFDQSGGVLFSQMVFGPRPKKPKWSRVHAA